MTERSEPERKLDRLIARNPGRLARLRLQGGEWHVAVDPDWRVRLADLAPGQVEAAQLAAVARLVLAGHTPFVGGWWSDGTDRWAVYVRRRHGECP